MEISRLVGVTQSDVSKTKQEELEGWFSSQEYWLLFQKGQVRFLEPIWQLMAASNFSSRGFNTFL